MTGFRTFALAAVFAVGSAVAAVATTITFDSAVGGNPNTPYVENGFSFVPNQGTNDVKCFSNGCLKEVQQGVVTTMTKVGGGAFDLTGFYFNLIGQGTRPRGVNDITVTGTFANNSTTSLVFKIGDLLNSFTNAAVTPATNPSLTNIAFNQGYLVSILNGVFNNVVSVSWTTNSTGVQSAQARLDNVTVADPAPVPVPAAGLMLLGGLAAMGMARRRKA